MKNTFFVFVFTTCIFFSGCSWVERFVIFNTSAETITVKYTISDHQKGFPLFNGSTDVYELKNNTTIDWYKSIKVEDLDTAALSFHFKLPQNTALVFGYLHNDTYEKYDQYFINDRYFNLNELEISGSKEKIIVSPERFDTVFKKKKGIIKYIVK